MASETKRAAEQIGKMVDDGIDLPTIMNAISLHITKTNDFSTVDSVGNLQRMAAINSLKRCRELIKKLPTS